MGTIVVVVAYHPKPQLVGGDQGINSVVDSLFEAAENRLLSILDDANPGAGHIDVAQTCDIAVIHTSGIEFNGGDGSGADDALSERVAGPHQLFGRHRLQAQAAVLQCPHLIIGVVVPLPDAA